jgi:(2Fe-2S) ferredoxin
MPFRHHIFFCENNRSADDPRGSCTARGSQALRAHAKERCHKLGLKGDVRVNMAGCLDQCAHGPAVVVYGAADPAEGVWYTLKDTAEVDEVIDQHLVGNTPVERLKMPRR